MAARFKLRFGPYRMPRLKLGQRAECEYAGTVRVAAIGDAPVQWPLGRVWGHRIPVLCGDLVKAVKQEAACDVAAAWGLSPYLVGQWRKALNVRRTIGTHLRLHSRSEFAFRRIEDQACRSDRARPPSPVRRST